jgi:serine/threonine-protein kinase
VALKVLAPTVMQSERARELFLREVRAAAQLNHPNIVAAYDASEGEGRYYLVLEYVDGPNLEQLVRDHGPLPVSQACDYIRQAALGLQCAHERGMVHRDIKPANILVNRGGLDGKSPDVIKISDFGLARLQAPDVDLSGDAPVCTILTKDNTVMGTPDYLSPEQARNLHKTDIRSDLYSLGCTFYFLLTGQVPFPGGKVMDKLIRHGTERPQPIADLRPVVPAEVVAIVNRLMAKHPKERYQTPAELADVLCALAVAGSTPWAPVGPAQPHASLAESGETKGCDSEPDVAAVAPPESSALVQTVSNELSPTAPDSVPRHLPSLLAKAHGLGPLLAVAAALGFLGGVAIISVFLLLFTLLHR